MYLIRDVFRCKLGKVSELARRLEQTIPSMTAEDNFRNCRVVVDSGASYWTVVLQAEVEESAQFARHMESYGDSGKAMVRWGFRISGMLSALFPFPTISGLRPDR